jgi:hypothetical protein
VLGLSGRAVFFPRVSSFFGRDNFVMRGGGILAGLADAGRLVVVLVVLAVLLIGCFGVIQWASGGPVVVVNPESADPCRVTPVTATVFVLDGEQNVVVRGTFSGNCSNPVPPVMPPDPLACNAHNTSDLDDLGYVRMCAGNVRSLNSSLHARWDNQYSGLMSGPWPGAAGQFGFGLVVTVNAQGYGSFAFNTGGTEAGVTFQSNTSYGVQGMLSVSTLPGDTFGGSTVCSTPGTAVNLSSKAGTKAQCKLKLNTDYYLTISMADYFAPHLTDCEGNTCSTGWTVYRYGN